VLVGVLVGALVGVVVGSIVTKRHAENSDVLPAESVAVAVMKDPGGTLTERVVSKPVLHEASVVTETLPARPPRFVSPSPNPEGSHELLEKNWRMKLEFGTELRVPRIVVPVPEGTALVRTGKFWKRFGPRPPSQSLLGVTPSEPRSIPSAPLS